MSDVTNDEARVAEIREFHTSCPQFGVDCYVCWLLDQRDRYKAAVDAVMDIHYDSGSDLNSSPGVTWCAGCGNRAWPCPTIKAITDALGGDS